MKRREPALILMVLGWTVLEDQHSLRAYVPTLAPGTTEMTTTRCASDG